MYHESKHCLVRQAKTCFKFPLDGRAFTAYLHIKTNLLRKSDLLIIPFAALKDFPSSKHPTLQIEVIPHHILVYTHALCKILSSPASS